MTYYAYMVSLDFSYCYSQQSLLYGRYSLNMKIVCQNNLTLIQFHFILHSLLFTFQCICFLTLPKPLGFSPWYQLLVGLLFHTQQNIIFLWGRPLILHCLWSFLWSHWTHLLLWNPTAFSFELLWHWTFFLENAVSF